MAGVPGCKSLLMRPTGADEGAGNLLPRGGEVKSFLDLDFFVVFFNSLAIEVGKAAAGGFFAEADPAGFLFKLPTLLPLSPSFC